MLALEIVQMLVRPKVDLTMLEMGGKLELRMVHRSATLMEKSQVPPKVDLTVLATA
jgi:hypothetical protein